MITVAGKEVPQEVVVAWTLIAINRGMTGIKGIPFGSGMIKIVEDIVAKYPEWFQDIKQKP